MPVGWKSGLDEIVREVFEFAVQDAFGFVTAVCEFQWISLEIGASSALRFAPLRSARGGIKKEFWGMLLAPLCVDFRC